MKSLMIIGGGASGMTAAISAAQEAERRGISPEITILEQKDSVGRKILATGNGSCNLSNEKMDLSCYHSDTPEEVKAVIDRFGVRETLDFFRDLGIVTRSRDGYLYPRSGQASAVRDALLLRLSMLPVRMQTGVRVTEIQKEGDVFLIKTEQKAGGMKQGHKKTPVRNTLRADTLILAAGGEAAPKFGSDGSGYDLATSLGHSLSTVVPALVQLRIQAHPFRKVEGVRTIAKVTALVDGEAVAEDTGELQMTGACLSGIPVFQISRQIAKALAAGKKADAAVDFLPEMKEEDLRYFLLARRDLFPENTAGEYLEGIFNKRLLPALLTLADIRIKTRVKELSEDQIRRLTAVCKNAVVPIEDTNGFDHAQVCAGGVRLDEVNTETMESLETPGLYLTGELLDADGICGGYNLQWAWATGYLAGRSAADALEKKEEIS